MADFTTTTNLNLKKPAVGGSSDKWGEYLNADLDTIDTEIQSLKTASTSRSLESLSNVLDTTPTTGQLLQYDTANWKAATVTIPEDIDDLGNVTVSSPADGQVLAYSTSTSRWENQTPGAATIPDGTITTAKLSTSLQGQVNLILQTTGTPTDDQILRYNATTTNWEFQDLPGGTISALSDTDVSGISNKDVLVYNSTSGDWVSRPLAIADVTGLQTSLDAKLESSDLSVSSLTDTTITTTADNSVLVYDASDSKWKNEGPSTARTSLGLGTLATQSTITESQISDLQSYITASSTDTLTNKSGNISQWTNDSGYLTAETNDLGSAVTGTLPIANGGTGVTSLGSLDAAGLGSGAATDGYVLTADGAGGAAWEQILAVQTNTTNTFSANQIISVADNTNAALRITQTGTGNALVVEDDTSTDSTPFVVNNIGRVGIGTVSPASSLDIASAGIRIVVGRKIASNVDEDSLAIVGGTAGAESAEIELYGGSHSTFPSLLVLKGDEQHFRTAAGTERMRIDSSGNVGIGTDAPTEKLDVSGNINATGALTLGTALAVAEGGTGVTSLSSLDAADLGSGAATDGYVLTADGAGGAAWEAASGGASLPAGAILSFAMALPPSGWLVCDGSALSRTTYASLFTAIGTTWGTGDGSTTFNLPDLRGAFLRGSGSHGTETMADTNAFAGPSIGSFENDQYQSHIHQFTGYDKDGNGNNFNFAHSSSGTPRTMPVSVAYIDDAEVNSNGTPRKGDETRPFNAGILYCIKF